jgi:hypothetical protein
MMSFSEDSFGCLTQAPSTTRARPNRSHLARGKVLRKPLKVVGSLGIPVVSQAAQIGAAVIGAGPSAIPTAVRETRKVLRSSDR